MQRFDLGHLEILEVLLETQSVSKAAQLLNVTPSAVSRSLTKIRGSLKDKILIPAGRDLILTKLGEQLRQELKAKVDDVRKILFTKTDFEPGQMKRQFHIRASDYVSGLLAEVLAKQFAEKAPLSGFVFHAEGDEDADALRYGKIDIDIGVVGNIGSEFMTQVLFKDKFVTVFNRHHFKKDKISMDEFCDANHVIVSRRGKTSVAIDEQLLKQKKRRKVLGTMSSFYEAFETASRVKCLVVAPQILFERSGHWFKLSKSALPLNMPEVQISQTWHPKHQADPEHRWLRDLILNALHPQK